MHHKSTVAFLCPPGWMFGNTNKIMFMHWHPIFVDVQTCTDLSTHEANHEISATSSHYKYLKYFFKLLQQL